MASRVEATAVVVLASAATQLLAANHHRKSIAVHNAGPNAIYVGPSNVTTATGYPIAAGASRDFSIFFLPEALYARAATADQVAPADTRVLASYDG